MLNISALGQGKLLGCLYNARTGVFGGSSIFSVADIMKVSTDPNVQAKFCTESEVPHINVAHSYDECLSDRYKLMKVDGFLKVGVLCGLVSVEGAGHYLQEEKHSSRAVSSSIRVSLQTKSQSSLLTNADLKNLMVSTIAERDATHFVSEIVWGGNAVLTVTFRNEENADKSKISGNLSAIIKQVASAIEGKVELDMEARQKASLMNLSYMMKIDGITKALTPTSVEECVATMKDIVRIICQANDGKGVPLSYKLSPIENFVSVMQLERALDEVIEQLASATINDIEHFFQQAEEFIAAVNDNDCDMKTKYQGIVNDEIFEDFETFKEYATASAHSARDAIGTMVKKIRLGIEKNVPRLNRVLKVHSEALSDLVKGLKKFKWISEKHMLISQTYPHESSSSALSSSTASALSASSIEFAFQYCGRGSNWYQECIGRECFLLFFSYQWVQENMMEWSKLVTMMKTLHGEKTDRGEHATSVKFLLVDVDFSLSQSDFPSSLVIKFWSNDCFKSGDVYADRLKEQEMAFVQRKHGVHPTQLQPIPNNRVAVKIKCPRNLCGEMHYTWSCQECREVIEYIGSDKTFYCRCGVTPVDGFLYRCCNLDHGEAFVPYPDLSLTSNLKKLLDNVVNILLMGQSGGGKSTFINAFANYLQTDDLEEIMSESSDLTMVYLVATKFSFTNAEDGSEKVVQVTPSVTVEESSDFSGNGQSNECQIAGQSSTQRCRTYSFVVGSKIIKLIDTPGLNDSRGIEQDKKNLDYIMAYLTNFKIVHAFLFLVPAGLSILTSQFKYCFKQLVTKLHRSAANNVLVVYTKSRTALGTGGSTVGLMKTLTTEIEQSTGVQIALNQHTQYSLDNEALQLAVGAHNGISFKPEIVLDFQGSWKSSSYESKRLLNYIVQNLEPHLVNDTLSIHKVRVLHSHLSQPIAIIAQIIDANLRIYADRLKRLNETMSRAELEKDLYVKQTYLHTSPLDQPQTVCTHPHCCTMDNVNGTSFTNYTTICHDGCSIEPCLELRNEKILTCCTFSPGHSWSSRCINPSCCHTWEYHRHIKVKFEVKERDVMAATIAKEKQSVEEMKEKVERLQADEEKERDQIRTVAAKIAVYLKQNSMCAFNDTVGTLIKEQLEHLKEASESASSPDYLAESTQRLKSMLFAYEVEKKAFEAANLDGSIEGCNNAEEAVHLLQSLYLLPRHGNELKTSVEVIQKAAEAADYCEVTFQPRRPTYSKSSVERAAPQSIIRGLGCQLSKVYETTTAAFGSIFEVVNGRK